MQNIYFKITKKALLKQTQLLYYDDAPIIAFKDEYIYDEDDDRLIDNYRVVMLNKHPKHGKYASSIILNLHNIKPNKLYRRNKMLTRKDAKRLLSPEQFKAYNDYYYTYY